MQSAFQRRRRDDGGGCSGIGVATGGSGVGYAGGALDEEGVADNCTGVRFGVKLGVELGLLGTGGGPACPSVRVAPSCVAICGCVDGGGVSRVGISGASSG